MLKPVRMALYALLILLIPAGPAASERASPNAAQQLAEMAAAHLRTDGLDAAAKSFHDPDGRFVDRDLYVFVMSLDGVIVANGYRPALVGRSFRGVRDSNGRAIADEAIATAVAKKAGWTEPYQFPDPLTNRFGTKQSYVILVDEHVVGVGVYLP